MTQNDFINLLKDNLEKKEWELSAKDIREILDTVGETIIEQLKVKPPAGKNAVAVVRGVGRFTKRDVPRRKGMKPFSDPPVEMWFPAKKSLRVTPQSSIKKAINPPKKEAAKKAPLKKAPAKKGAKKK